MQTLSKHDLSDWSQVELLADELWAIQQDEDRASAMKEVQDASDKAQKEAQDAIRDVQKRHGSKRDQPVTDFNSVLAIVFRSATRS